MAEGAQGGTAADHQLQSRRLPCTGGGGQTAGAGGSGKPPASEPAPDGPPKRTPPRAKKEQPRKSGLIRALPFLVFDEAKLPPREVMFASHYQRGQCTVTIGPGGAGKSTLDLVEAISMATAAQLAQGAAARALQGLDPQRRRRPTGDGPAHRRCLPPLQSADVRTRRGGCSSRPRATPTSSSVPGTAPWRSTAQPSQQS